MITKWSTDFPANGACVQISFSLRAMKQAQVTNICYVVLNLHERLNSFLLNPEGVWVDQSAKTVPYYSASIHKEADEPINLIPQLVSFFGLDKYL